MAYLVLVRHGKSEWNKLGLWTGLTDVELAEEGVEEARRAGEVMRDIEIHNAYTSPLRRTHQTFEEIRKAAEFDVDHISHAALNERDYGIHTGKNKWQVRDEIGEEKFQRLRRSWDEPVERGETLKDVHARVMPYYQEVILSQLTQGRNVLVVAHGNSLRALIKHLENLSDDEICSVEIGTGEVYCYTIGERGQVIGKEVRAANGEKTRV